MKSIRCVAILSLYVGLRAAGGWQAPHTGLTQMLALPDPSPCPCVTHGPTMPPDPWEPIR